jgi:glyoxylase-like metal-dependent hydrolase (beta-lactamase superfamily II)
MISLGTLRHLLEAGVRAPAIRTIFLTHDHPDHLLGLVDVLANDIRRVDATGRPAASGADRPGHGGSSGGGVAAPGLRPCP